jgi:hypothetical protein
MKFKVSLFILFFNIAAIVEKKHPIIISFTTIDSRIDHIKPMIDSLLEQTLQADKINLYLSQEKGVLNKGIEKNQIPEFIKELVNFKKINLIFTKDLGPHTKLIPCLKEHWNQDCIIITVDDDRIYPNNLVEIFYKNYLRENCIITCRSKRMVFENKDLSSIKKYQKWHNKTHGKDLLNFSLGVDGVLYKPEFFTEDVFDTQGIMYSSTEDDVWFNLIRLIKKIPVFAIKENLEIKSLEINNKINLWSHNKKNNNQLIQTTLKYLIDKNLL